MNQYLLLFFAIVCHFVLPSMSGVCDVSDVSRKYCGYQGINEASCKSSGCCWKAATISGKNYPWCFYDSGIAAKLKQVKLCEHYAPAVLTCNSTQQIKIHDVFYGRNADDNSCHNHGSITCFNPNATRIVQNICKTNSTCTVSPKGNIWNFDSITCDQLNAQLRINYICVAIESSVIPTSSFMTSSIFDVSTFVMVRSSLPVSTSIPALVSSPSHPDRASSSIPGSYSMASSLNAPNKTKVASSSTLGLQSSPSSTENALFTAVPSSSVAPNIKSNETSSSKVTPSSAPTITNSTAIPAMTPTASSLSPVEYVSFTSKYINASSTVTIMVVKTVSTSINSITVTPNATSMISKSVEASVTPVVKSSTAEVVATATVNKASQATQTTNLAKSSILPSSTKTTVSKSIYTVISSKQSLSASTKVPSMTMKMSSKWSTTTSHTVKVFSSMTLKPSRSATTSRASMSKSKTAQVTSKSKIVSTLVSKSHSQTPKTKVVTPTPSTKVVPSSSVKPTVVNPGTTDKNKGKFTKVEYILFGVGGFVILVLLIVLIYCFKKRSPYKHDVLTDDLPAAPSGLYYAADVPMEEIPQSSVRHIATKRLDGSYDNTGVERDEADDIFDQESERIHRRK